MAQKLIVPLVLAIGCLAPQGFAIDDSPSNREALITIVKSVSHPYSIQTASGVDSYEPNLLDAAKMLVSVHLQGDVSTELRELSRDAFLMLATSEAANIVGYNASSSTLLDIIKLAQGDGLPLTAGFFDILSTYGLAQQIQRLRDDTIDYNVEDLLKDLVIREIAARVIELGIRLKAEQMRGEVVARLIAVQREWSSTENDQRFAALHWSVQGADIHPRLKFTTESDQNDLVVALLLKNQARDTLNEDANYN
ncbi:MAG: hypothetical protein KDB27_01685, partial [Planctomycetales bacterium]|nr:hypothetical protein [Planctomycetales bacterium]